MYWGRKWKRRRDLWHTKSQLELSKVHKKLHRLYQKWVFVLTPTTEQPGSLVVPVLLVCSAVVSIQCASFLTAITSNSNNDSNSNSTQPHVTSMDGAVPRMGTVSVVNMWMVAMAMAIAMAMGFGAEVIYHHPGHAMRLICKCNDDNPYSATDIMLLHGTISDWDWELELELTLSHSFLHHHYHSNIRGDQSKAK